MEGFRFRMALFELPCVFPRQLASTECDAADVKGPNVSLSRPTYHPFPMVDPRWRLACLYTP